MIDKETTFLLIANNFAVSIGFGEIPIREIEGFSSQTTVGYVSHLIGCPTLPIIEKKSGKYILLNAAGSRVTNLLETLSVDTTILAYVMKSDIHTEADIKLARFMLPKSSIRDTIRAKSNILTYYINNGINI